MKPAIKELLQLSDSRLFDVVAEGIKLIVEHAEDLEATALRLTKIEEHYSAALVRALAREESAKALILVDLVRCPRDNQQGRSRMVAAFGSHLAKEIYAYQCHCKPADFAEVMRTVDGMRHMYYLSGDWVWSSVRGPREERMYVDYVKVFGDKGVERLWASPLRPGYYPEYEYSPRSLEVIRALHRIGVTTAYGLSMVADVWRDFRPEPETQWRGELTERNEATLIGVANAQDHGPIDPRDAGTLYDSWPFPLWPLDFTRTATPPIAELHRRRAGEVKRQMELDAQRDPPPAVSREKVELLSKIYAYYEIEYKSLVDTITERQTTRWKVIPSGAIRIHELQSYQRLRKMVCELSIEELMDLAVLGWYGRGDRSGWDRCHGNARDMISEESIDYVCGLGSYWLRGLERWERPPDQTDSS